MTELIPHPRSQESAPALLRHLKEIIAARCVITNDGRWLVSPKGLDNSWLIDMRQALLIPEALDLISELFWDRFAYLLPFQVGGLEIAAIPLVVALVLKARSRGLRVNGFIIRKERKPYGFGKIIEGQLTPEPIVVVDDILNSASSVERVRVVLAELEREINGVFTIIDFRSTRGQEWLAKIRLPASSFFTLEDFGLKSSSRTSPMLNQFENIWTFKSPNPNHFHVVPKSAPVVFEDKVIFGSDRGTLWALDSLSGKLEWCFQVAHRDRKGIWSRPALCEGRVFFGAYDGNLYCLDAANGQVIWRQFDADWIGSSPEVSLGDRVLWVGLEYEPPSRRGGVAAFNIDDGKKIWEYPVSSYVHGTPRYSEKHHAIAIGTNDNAVLMLDAFTGKLRWRFQTRGEVKEQPTFDDNRDLLYVTSFDGLIRGIDVESGSQVWAISTSNILYSSPMLLDSQLFVAGTDKLLHVIRLSTQEHTTIELGSKCFSTPVLIGQSLFFGTNGGAIWELDPNAISLIGHHQLPDAVTNRIAADPNRNFFFALTQMNQLFAFRRASGTPLSSIPA